MSDIIAVIEKHFGGLVVTRVSEHEFLVGMDITLPGDKMVHVSMKHYTNEAISYCSIPTKSQEAQPPLQRKVFSSLI